MNGEEVLTDMQTGVKVNGDLVRLLETALGDAKAGKIIAGGVVAVVGASSFMAFSVTGPFFAETIAGAEVMKSDAILKMRQPRQSPILRAGAMPAGRG